MDFKNREKWINEATRLFKNNQDKDIAIANFNVLMDQIDDYRLISNKNTNAGAGGESGTTLLSTKRKMKIKYFSEEQEIPEGAIFMSSVVKFSYRREETRKDGVKETSLHSFGVVHYFLVPTL